MSKFDELRHPIEAAAEADPAAQRGRHGAATAALYIGFAVIAVASNLGSQWLAAELLGTWSIFFVELVIGTGVGVVVKFLLDRAFIFDGAAQNKPVAQQAGLYLATSVLTTFIFWGGEGLSVWLLGKQDVLATHLCEAGTASCVALLGRVNTHLGAGAIALAIGYLVKYQLDKRITFA